MDAVKEKRRQLNTTVTGANVIPCGLTAMLLPLDVCLSKSFKDRKVKIV